MRDIVRLRYIHRKTECERLKREHVLGEKANLIFILSNNIFHQLIIFDKL